MLDTPFTNCLSQAVYEEVYPPSEDTFLFLDALEKDIDFLNHSVKPAVTLEVGSGSGIISTFLFKALHAPPLTLCIDISTKVYRSVLLFIFI